MFCLPKIRNYIIVKNKKELDEAKQCSLCRFIVMEERNNIYIWTKYNGKWLKEKYTFFGNDKEKDDEITGFKAYQSFFNYCGKESVEEMKHILRPIAIWESEEQLHYYNYEYSNTKIYENIYEFDANSAFTYGVNKLPKGFEKLKEYMSILYDRKEKSTNKITRSRYKNLQNFLIGYFARIRDFISTRSKIIFESNENIKKRMAEIINKGGKVFLSNTDSIVTDSIGADIMQKHLGKEVGKFKLETKTDRLFYKSSNAYQLGDKIKYSGVGYYAQKHTDFFKDEFALQSGSLIKGLRFSIDESEKGYSKLCQVTYNEIEVVVVNAIGEELDRFYYTIKE